MVSPSRVSSLVYNSKNWTRALYLSGQHSTLSCYWALVSCSETRPLLNSATFNHLLHGSDNGCRKECPNYAQECQWAVFFLLSPCGLLFSFCLWLPLEFAIEEKVVSDLRKDTTHLHLCQHSLSAGHQQSADCALVMPVSVPHGKPKSAINTV